MKITTSDIDINCLPTAPFPFQQTYATPLEDLNKFVHTLLCPFKVQEATVCIEQIVFTPRELIWYLRGLGIAVSEGDLNDSTLHAATSVEVHDLLECVLGQWTDFAFVPSTEDFAIYADHDEYTTVFTATAEMLDSLRVSMKEQGFKEIEGWTWTRSPSPSLAEGAKTSV